MRDVILKRIQRAVREKVFSGCSVGVVRRDPPSSRQCGISAGQGGSRLVLPFGVLADSLFDVASITKAIPTSSLALKLIDEERLGMDEAVQTYVPEFQNRYARDIRVRHLLTHTVGYDGSFALSSYANRGPNEVLRAVFTSDVPLPPGKKFLYTNAASILLGLVVERIFGKKLDTLAREIFFEPLEMRRTTFSPLLEFSREEIVPTEEDGRGGILQGIVHDESARALRQEMVPGSAGLFSTVPDLLTFLEMLLRGGELEGERYFSKDAAREMRTNQLQGIGESHGLGWELCRPRWTPLEVAPALARPKGLRGGLPLTGWMGEKCGSATFGKTGFTGCSVLCDMERGVGVVILSNYTYPKRKKDAEAINAVRRYIHDVVFSF